MLAGSRFRAPRYLPLESGMPNALPPSDLKLRIEINVVAPSALQEVGIAYWSLLDLDPDTSEPRWEQRVSALPYKSWSSCAHYAAAAAVTAVLPGYSCGTCEGELALASRQTLADALAGKSVDCRACHKRVDEQAARILDPRSLESRVQRAAEALEQQAAEQVARELEQTRREVITEHYLVEPEDQEHLLADAPLLARVGALAVIHAVGDKGGLIYPIDTNDQTIGPNASLSTDLFIAAWRGELLKIHPTSPTTAFVWDGETGLGGSIYPSWTRFFVPGDGTLEERLKLFVEDLRARLDLARMWSTERSEMADLAQRLIAEEAGRYFVHMLGEHNLPDLTETHEEALRTATVRGAGLFSIGHLYRMAWSSARDASSAYQRNAGMSKPNAITYGLKQFERWIQRASDNLGSLSEPFSEDRRNLPLSAVTGIVFRTVLGLDPMSTSPSEIMEALAGSPDAELRDDCDACIPERHELMDWIRTSTDLWDGSEFREILGILGDWTPPICAPGCAHERIGHVADECGRVYDRIVSRVGETDAAIVTAEATAVANALRAGVRTGDALLTAVVQMLQARHAQAPNEH